MNTILDQLKQVLVWNMPLWKSVVTLNSFAVDNYKHLSHSVYMLDYGNSWHWYGYKGQNKFLLDIFITFF